MKMLSIPFLLILVLGLNVSAIQSDQNETYNNHTICFEIPQNWSVVRDIQDGNDTQIVLSDGSNAIRIDLVKCPEISKIIGDYLEYHVSKSDRDSFGYDVKNLSGNKWYYAYERYPWYSNDAICDYYKKNIVRSVTELGSSGSGISVHPDGVEYAGVATNSNRRSDLNEWIIAWTKRGYDNEFIGVHSLIEEGYPEKEVEWGASGRIYIMPEPLWIVLTTINRGKEPLSKPPTSSSLVDLV